jgi:hypothetical protein
MGAQTFVRTPEGEKEEGGGRDVELRFECK